MVAEVHRRAAGWFEAAGELDSAVGHAFAAQDAELAAVVVGRAMIGNHWSGRRATTRAWLERFGDDDLLERPWLAVLAAWETLSSGDPASTERLRRPCRARLVRRAAPPTARHPSSPVARSCARACVAAGADDALRERRSGRRARTARESLAGHGPVDAGDRPAHAGGRARSGRGARRRRSRPRTPPRARR